MAPNFNQNSPFLNGNLDDQILNAKEMGYSDGEIRRALELNQKGKIGQKHFLAPFSSASAMIDALSAAQQNERGPSTWSSSTLLADSKGRTLFSGIGRSISLNEGNGPSEVRRLIGTFESENGGSRFGKKMGKEKEEMKSKGNEMGELVKELEEMKKRNRELEEEMRELKVGERGENAENGRMDLVEKLKLEVETKNKLLESLTGPQLELEKLARELEETQRKCREYAQTVLCGICMTKNRDVLFMPCLHFTCCKICSANMQNCSICRHRIMGKIELFQ